MDRDRDYHKPSPVGQWLSKPRNFVALILGLVVVTIGIAACYSTTQLNSIEHQRLRIQGGH